MTAPVISFGTGWVSGDPTPLFSGIFTALAVNDTVSFQWGRDGGFSTSDGTNSNTIDSTEWDGLSALFSGVTIYNGLNYFRVSHNGEWSNTLSDTITGSIDAPSSGGAWIDPKAIKANEERKQRLKKNDELLEQTIRLAHQRLTGKVTEPPILKNDPKPERLAVHAKKMAEQLVEKSRDSARLRTRNKQIIADLQRLANEIAANNAEEEEAIVSLLFS